MARGGILVTCPSESRGARRGWQGDGVVLAWRVPDSTCSFGREGKCMKGAEIPEGEPSYACDNLASSYSS